MNDLSGLQFGDIVWFAKPGNLTPYRVKFGKIIQNRGGRWVSIFVNDGRIKDKKIIANVSTIFNSQLEAEVFSAIEMDKYISSLKNPIEIETFNSTISVVRSIITSCEKEFPDVVLKLMMSK